jgi:hypothetical protein
MRVPNVSRMVLPLLAAALIASGCLSREERELLDRLRAEYKEVAHLAFDGEFELTVYARSANGISRDSVSQLLRRFATSPPFSGTLVVVYLNYYDAQNTRQYQLYYNAVTQAVTRSDSGG